MQLAPPFPLSLVVAKTYVGVRPSVPVILAIVETVLASTLKLLDDNIGDLVLLI
jgi:hypothetical protein